MVLCLKQLTLIFVKYFSVDDFWEHTGERVYTFYGQSHVVAIIDRGLLLVEREQQYHQNFMKMQNVTEFD